jgi:flagellar hook assembly protein FlgD
MGNTRYVAGAAIVGLALLLPAWVYADWGEDWGTMIWGQTVSAPSADQVATFAMRAAPNPFTAGTTISYTLPTDTTVDVRVLSVTGRLVRTLHESSAHVSGNHVVQWDGRDVSGTPVASGVYFYQIETAELRESRRIILNR